ncbi:hypothetical protein GWK47_006032 [Chionoecetes opilio]|uniref:Uncharacterized protein n=1 Tax=Chionoecetes opilio TaxID=41210 RepID=A0A8J4Y878_CHIOP|nr:hypothetical protein GWK47_006032 [Chionoecetes opilio]
MAKQRPSPVAEAWLVAAIDDVLGFIFSIKEVDHWLAKLAICQQLVSGVLTNIKREVGRKLKAPNVTRLNSLYVSMEDLSEVLDTKLAQINVICMQNGIATFNQVDKGFEEPRTHGYREHQLYPLSNKMGKELESWYSQKQRNKLLEQAIFPASFRAAWVDVFVKYNTAIPSYAAVERLFSQGLDIK